MGLLLMSGLRGASLDAAQRLAQVQAAFIKEFCVSTTRLGVDQRAGALGVQTARMLGGLMAGFAGSLEVPTGIVCGLASLADGSGRAQTGEPGGAAPPSSRLRTIGVLGENATTKALQTGYDGAEAGGYKLRVVEVSTPAEWRRLDLLFLANTEERRMAEVVAVCRGLPVLTVSDAAGFCAAGGDIRLFTKAAGRGGVVVRYEVNPEAVFRRPFRLDVNLVKFADNQADIKPGSGRDRGDDLGK